MDRPGSRTGEEIKIGPSTSASFKVWEAAEGLALLKTGSRRSWADVGIL